MGFLISKLINLFPSSKNTRMVMLGLDNAGKTTILYKICSKGVEQTAPTIGFNLESVAYKNVKFQVWDLGGQETLRPYWRAYYPQTDLVIYVIDSSDKDRIDTAKSELLLVLDEEELKGVPLVIFANKQDKPGAMSEADISDYLGLSGIKNRQWAIFKCCAKDGTGLEEGLEWIAEVIKTSK